MTAPDHNDNAALAERLEARIAKRRYSDDDYDLDCQIATALRRQPAPAPEGWVGPSLAVAPLPWSGKEEAIPCGGECDDVDLPFVIRDAMGVVVLSLYESWDREHRPVHEIVGERIVQAVNRAAPPAPDAGPTREAIRREVAFLLERLAEFENEDLTEEQARAWNGHVLPSVERLRALATPEKNTEAGRRFRHLKRGTTYTVIGEGELQVAGAFHPQEGDRMVAYRGEDGRVWFRLADEFYDGDRFEPLPTPEQTTAER